MSRFEREYQDAGEVFVILKMLDDKTHHFMDVAADERTARQSVLKTYPGAKMREEKIGQYGVSKRIHFVTREGTKIMINCMEPNKESLQLE